VVTGEEHGRQALAAASVTASARTRVIQADYEVSKVKDLLEAATAGSANEHALDAVTSIYAAEQILGEVQALLQSSADSTDEYVDVVAPGLRRGRSAEPTPVTGEELLKPKKQRRSARDAFDRGLRGVENVEGAAKATDNAMLSAKHLDPPPAKTGTSTAQPVPQAHAPATMASNVDALTALFTSGLLLAKGSVLAVDRVRQGWKSFRKRRRG
jgi:hypothetical protein